jgi:hypothetical protein
LKNKAFFYIPPERARYWPTENDPHAFGNDVAAKFPSAQIDIYQASICLATDLSTASVFHLMRVMELGLSALGRVFNISLAHTNWEPAITGIEAKIRGMRSDPTWNTVADMKEKQEFYAQVASHFGVLKDAWRNYTMHSRGKYTTNEAELIYSNAKSFMQKLSQRLSE